MELQTKIISDQNILSLIAENKMEAWKHLYDKYSAAMFGIIYNLTSDRKLAEEIFKETFIQLKERKILSKNTHALCSCLLKHTHTFAQQQLNDRGISLSYNHTEKTSLIEILCSQYISIKQLASNFNLTEAEIKKNLRAEFLALRSQNENVHSNNQQKVVNERYLYNFKSSNHQ